MFSKRLVRALFTVALFIFAVPVLASGTINWADFTKTVYVPNIQCVDYEWVETVWFDTDGNSGSDLSLECVKYADVGGSTRRGALSAGDLIDVSIQHNAVPSSSIEITLQMGGSVSWAKQLRVFDGFGSHWDIQVNNSSTSATVGLWANQISTGSIEFLKPMFLGIWTGVYKLDDLESKLKPGDRVTFTWIKD